MNERPAKILARWDAEADVWVATSFQITGLSVSAPTKPELVKKLRLVCSELIKANKLPYTAAIIEYIEEEPLEAVA